MSYARREYETLEAARTRLVAAWERYIGPIPVFRTRGRVVPPPIGLMAENLDLLVTLGIAPALEPPVVRLVEALDGRTIYSVLNRADAASIVHRPAYQQIAIAIAPRHFGRYQVFFRSVRDDTYGGRDATEGLHADGEQRVGYYESDLKRELLGHEASPWWVQRGKYRAGDMIRSTTLQGADITAGRLEALTSELLVGAPGYVVGWFFEINEVATDEVNARWLRMKQGERNCVAEAVRRSYGPALTDKISKAIDEFEDSLVDGATEEDVHDLTKALRCRIRILDLAGNPQYEERIDPATKKPYYSNARRVITLYRHDGHVSTHEPGIPKVERVAVFEGETPGRPDEKPDEAITRHIANAIAHIRKIRPEQAQIVGGEIISADGTLYRPRTIDRSLHSASAELGERPEFAVNLPGPEGLEYNIDMASGEAFPDILHVGGAQSYRFKAWRAEQGILSIWKGPSRQQWRSAAVEACVYRRDSVGNEPLRSRRHIDMRAAYLACDAEFGTGPAHEWASVFGFPRGGRMRTASYNGKISMLDAFTGLVEYTLGIHFNESTPRGVLTQLGLHFGKSETPMLPIPLAVWLHERGYASMPSGSLVHYCDKMHGINFPVSRDAAIRYVGSCSYRSATRTFFTRDLAEANHFARAYDSYYEALDDGYLISWDQGEAKHDFSHIRAYVLAYLAIAMGDAEAKLGDAVIERDTDAFIIRSDADPAAMLGKVWTATKFARWGQFRDKELGVASTARYATAAPTKRSFGIPVAGPALPALDEHEAHSLIAEIGPGGFGKTHYWLNRTYPPSEEPVVLCQNNAAVADLKSVERNPHGYPVFTYHEWFRLGHNDPSTWTPLQMGSKALHTSRLLWDEFPTAGAELLSRVLPWLRKLGVHVVLAGDPLGQLQDFEDPDSGLKVGLLLTKLHAHIRGDGLGYDWRAKDCPKLQDAKRRAWCQDTETQIAELRAVATCLSFKDAIALWTPSDLVLEPTNRLGEEIARSLSARRRASFPNEPLRLRFKPVDSKKFAKRGGVLPSVKRPDGGLVEAALGTLIEVDPRACADYDKELWFPDDTSTIHSIQGRTIKAPRRIFICEDNLAADWCKNAPYVAMSRAQRADQLILFRVRG